MIEIINGSCLYGNLQTKKNIKTTTNSTLPKSWETSWCTSKHVWETSSTMVWCQGAPIATIEPYCRSPTRCAQIVKIVFKTTSYRSTSIIGTVMVSNNMAHPTNWCATDNQIRFMMKPPFHHEPRFIWCKLPLSWRAFVFYQPNFIFMYRRNTWVYP